MKRDINVNLEFTNSELIICAIERLTNGTYVEVFSNFSDFENSQDFIAKSISEIEKKLGTKISQVSVVLAQSKKIDHKIILSEIEIKLTANMVTKSDIDNIISTLEAKHNTPEAIVSLVQPFSFYVTEKEMKEPKKYNKTPIGVAGCKLKMFATVTTIDRQNIYNYVRSLLDPLNIKINILLLNSQAEMFNSISDTVQANGGMLLRVGKHRSTISFIKNYAIFKSVNITNYGLNKIYDFVAKEYNLKYDFAKQSVINYGSFNTNEAPRVISLKKVNEDRYNTLSCAEINEILTKFIDTVMLNANKEINESIVASTVDNVPLVLTGQITKINGYEEYISGLTQTKLVSTYNPLTFIENNSRNINALGVFKHITRLKDMNFSSVDTVVDTNPNSLKMLFEPGNEDTKQKQKFFKKLLSSLEGKHGYK